MVATWIIERDVFSEECFNIMVEHFKNNSIPYHIVRVIPFIHEIEGNVPVVSGPVVVYGSIGVQKLAERYGWKPGIWNSEEFNETYLINVIGNYALNHDSISCEFKWAFDVSPWEEFFIKPNTDTKEFAGTLITRSEFLEWKNGLLASGYIDKNVLDLEVVISEPKKIGCEWRLIILNGKVIEYSIYKQYKKVMPKHECPKEVIDFAERITNIYNPSPVFVMDICESEDGYKVIEVNTFNSAGLYKCDVGIIIDRINEYLNV